ncbi:MAG: phosphonate ABC transporter ATP-binding protein [Rhizobiales bacterium]|nr:phosphonate ABC transporter ATP-binding protein [Hyphomicrobiales bacterium]
MLVIDGVSRRFDTKTAVANVSLRVERGQFVGIIGRSGAGKSTLLRMINRLVEPTSGQIMFDGIEVTKLRGSDLRAWRARSAMIFQQFNLVPRLDVLTNILLGRIGRHGTLPSLFMRFTDAERAMAVEALDRLDLMAAAFQRAETLSGGQQQRVAIARALMQEPSIVLADEPIASLDPRNAEHVMSSLKAINGENGITILCSLHTLEAARRYCDRIVGMANGKVVFEGTPADLTQAAVHEIYQGEEREGDVSDDVAAPAGWLAPRPEVASAPA